MKGQAKSRPSTATVALQALSRLSYKVEAHANIILSAATHDLTQLQPVHVVMLLDSLVRLQRIDHPALPQVLDLACQVKVTTAHELRYLIDALSSLLEQDLITDLDDVPSKIGNKYLHAMHQTLYSPQEHAQREEVAKKLATLGAPADVVAKIREGLTPQQIAERWRYSARNLPAIDTTSSSSSGSNSSSNSSDSTDEGAGEKVGVVAAASWQQAEMIAAERSALRHKVE